MEDIYEDKRFGPNGIWAKLVFFSWLLLIYVAYRLAIVYNALSEQLPIGIVIFMILVMLVLLVSGAVFNVLGFKSIRKIKKENDTIILEPYLGTKQKYELGQINNIEELIPNRIQLLNTSLSHQNKNYKLKLQNTRSFYLSGNIEGLPRFVETINK